MPRITSDKYQVFDVSVSYTAQGFYPHSRQNILTPYSPSATIINHLDAPGMEYFEDAMPNLYNEDFLWGTAI